jgi:hypothetical protein
MNLICQGSCLSSDLIFLILPLLPLASSSIKQLLAFKD